MDHSIGKVSPEISSSLLEISLIKVESNPAPSRPSCPCALLLRALRRNALQNVARRQLLEPRRPLHRVLRRLADLVDVRAVSCSAPARLLVVIFQLDLQLRVLSGALATTSAEGCGHAGGPSLLACGVVVLVRARVPSLLMSVGAATSGFGLYALSLGLLIPGGGGSTVSGRSRSWLRASTTRCPDAPAWPFWP